MGNSVDLFASIMLLIGQVGVLNLTVRKGLSSRFSSKLPAEGCFTYSMAIFIGGAKKRSECKTLAIGNLL